MAHTRESIVGVKFGRLLVESRHLSDPNQFLCLCDCGNTLYVSYRDLVAKRKHTCGCYERVKHGGTVRDGSLYSLTYRSWEGMKQRCLNPKSPDYKNYGGRGITVCERWMQFENFLMDMGEKEEGTSLGRINNDGNYEPSNCRWETAKQQQNNTRSVVKIGGMTIEELVKITGLNHNTIYLRRFSGATDEEIINTSYHTPRKSMLRNTNKDIGMRNGKLVVEEVNKRGNEVVYTCKCDCGNTKEVTRRNFTKTQSCGCIRSESAKHKKATKPSSISQEYDSLPLFNSQNIGKRYEKLTVLEVRRKTLKPGVYRQYAKCKCDCGNETIVAMGNLTGSKQHTLSCGCSKEGSQGPKVSTIGIGSKFGSLTIINIKTEGQAKKAVCRCDCGTFIYTAIANLKYGRVYSCGCILNSADDNPFQYMCLAKEIEIRRALAKQAV